MEQMKFGQGNSSQNPRYNDDEDENKARGMKIRDLVKSYVGQPALMGKYEENLEEVIAVLEDMADMCG